MGPNAPTLPPLSNFHNNYLPFLQNSRFNHFQHLQQPMHARNIFQKRTQDEVKNEAEGKGKNLLEMFKSGLSETKEPHMWDLPAKLEQQPTTSPSFPLSFNLSLPLKSMQQFPMPVFISSPSASSTPSSLLSALPPSRSSINSFMPMLNLSPYNSLFNLAFSAAAIANYKNRMRKDMDQKVEKDTLNGLGFRHKQDTYPRSEEIYQNKNLQNCLNMRLLRTPPEFKDKSIINKVSVENIKSFFKNKTPTMDK